MNGGLKNRLLFSVTGINDHGLRKSLSLSLCGKKAGEKSNRHFSGQAQSLFETFERAR